MGGQSHTALSTCPFCGGEGKQTGVRDGYVIYCVQCHAKAAPAYHGRGGWEEAAERAAAQWNARAPNTNTRSDGLLRPTSERPTRCYCPPDRCDAPIIMGRRAGCFRTSSEHPAKATGESAA